MKAYIVLRSTSDLLLPVDPQVQDHLRVPGLVYALVPTAHESTHLEDRLGLGAILTPAPDGLLDQVSVHEIFLRVQLRPPFITAVPASPPLHLIADLERIQQVRPQRVPHALRHIDRRRDTGRAVVAVVEVIDESRALGRRQESLEPGRPDVSQAGLVGARAFETRVGRAIPVVLDGELLTGVEDSHIGGGAAGADDDRGSRQVLQVLQKII